METQKNKTCCKYVNICVLIIHELDNKQYSHRICSRPIQNSKLVFTFLKGRHFSAIHVYRYFFNEKNNIKTFKKKPRKNK